MKARKLKKKTDLHFKNPSNFVFRKKMALKLFEFVEHFMMEIFLLKLDQFEKTGSICKTFSRVGNLIIHFHFSKLEVDHVFGDFTLLLFNFRTFFNT